MNRYLYIDDNTKEEADGLIAGLADDLEILFQNPTGTWETERKQFLNSEFNSYDGLILDLNLEEKKNPDSGRISYYKGSTLAQELRNLAKSKELKEIPIILLSANKNLEKYFDQTNKDLFDLILKKESLNSTDIFKESALKLNSIANAYKKLSKDSNINNVLDSDLKNEDIRFISEIEYQLSNKPLHSISNFFIKEVLEKNGILINEKLLFTRLGIDTISSDANELIKLKTEILLKYKYNGIFSEGWERWWMNGIEELWVSFFCNNKSLRSLDSNGRVDIINQKLSLNLKPIQKSDKSKSLKFWTICKGTYVSIDNIDGLLVAGQEKIFPWQDKEYVCIDEALKPKNKIAWRDIAPTEKIKLEILKKRFPNERPNRL